MSFGDHPRIGDKPWRKASNAAIARRKSQRRRSRRRPRRSHLSRTQGKARQRPSRPRENDSPAENRTTLPALTRSIKPAQQRGPLVPTELRVERDTVRWRVFGRRQLAGQPIKRCCASGRACRRGDTSDHHYSSGRASSYTRLKRVRTAPVQSFRSAKSFARLFVV